MAQAGIVRLMLKEQGRDAVLLPVDTTGDREGGTNKDRWIDAIVELLRTGEADLAVHSAKDLPADDPEDLTIAAVPERGDPRDVLVAVDGAYFDGDGPRRGARVGTSSLRRAAQLRAAFPGIELVELHGNVPTRLRKLQGDGGPEGAGARRYAAGAFPGDRAGRAARDRPDPPAEAAGRWRSRCGGARGRRPGPPRPDPGRRQAAARRCPGPGARPGNPCDPMP